MEPDLEAREGPSDRKDDPPWGSFEFFTYNDLASEVPPKGWFDSISYDDLLVGYLNRKPKKARKRKAEDTADDDVPLKQQLLSKDGKVVKTSKSKSKKGPSMVQLPGRSFPAPPHALESVKTDGEFQTWLTWAKDVWRDIGDARKERRKLENWTAKHPAGPEVVLRAEGSKDDKSKSKSTALVEDTMLPNWQNATLPPVSTDFLGLPPPMVRTVLMLWDFMTLYYRVLMVERMELEEFLQAILSEKETHTANRIFAAFLRGVMLPAWGNRNQPGKDKKHKHGMVINALTWQEYLRRWLKQLCADEGVDDDDQTRWEAMAEYLSANSIYQLPISERLYVLKLFGEHVIRAPLIREHVDTGILVVENARKSTYKFRLLETQEQKRFDKSISEVANCLSGLVGHVVEKTAPKEMKGFDKGRYATSLEKRARTDFRLATNKRIEEQHAALAAAIERYPLRTKPLGRDRRYNSYYRLGGCNRYIFVMERGSHGFGYYHTAEQYKALLAYLNPKGIREHDLLDSLEKKGITWSWEKGFLVEVPKFHYLKCFEDPPVDSFHGPTASSTNEEDTGVSTPDAKNAQLTNILVKDRIRLRAAVVLQAGSSGERYERCEKCQESVSTDELHCPGCHTTFTKKQKPAEKFEEHLLKCLSIQGVVDSAKLQAEKIESAANTEGDVEMKEGDKANEEKGESNSTLTTTNNNESVKKEVDSHTNNNNNNNNSENGVKKEEEQKIKKEEEKVKKEEEKMKDEEKKETEMDVSENAPPSPTRTKRNGDKDEPEEEDETLRGVNRLALRSGKKVQSLEEVDETFKALKALVLDIEAAIPVEAVRNSTVKARTKWIEKIKFDTELSELCSRLLEIGDANLRPEWTRPWFNREVWCADVTACKTYWGFAALAYYLDRALIYSEGELRQVEKDQAVVSSSDEEGSSSSSSDESSDSDTKERHDADDGGCEVCGVNTQAGLLLLCDDCDKAYHIFCLKPPLRSIPSGLWYCPPCKKSRDLNKPVTRGSATPKSRAQPSPRVSARSVDDSQGMSFPKFVMRPAFKEHFVLPKSITGESSSSEEESSSEESEEDEEEESEEEEEESESGTSSEEDESEEESESSDDEASGPPCNICLQSTAVELCVCSSCGVGVHSDCYGIAVVADKSWQCSRCAAQQPKSTKCVLCQKPGGAMKIVAKSGDEYNGKWAHVLCALWIPGVDFEDSTLREPIIGLNGIDQRRFRLKCGVCEKQAGCCMQCMFKACKTSAHVSCGLSAEGKDKGFKFIEADSKRQFFCPSHDTS